MDNFKVDVRSDNRQELRNALHMALEGQPVLSYLILNEEGGPPRLMLFRRPASGTLPVITPLAPHVAEVFVGAWLDALPPEGHHDYTDLDGSVMPRAWRVRADGGDGALAYGDAVEVTGVWAWYHK